MGRSRHQKEPSGHYLILVNKTAANYSRRAVSKLIDAIKKNGRHYTIFEPDSAMALLQQAQETVRENAKPVPGPRRPDGYGPITAIVACGGDGTFNLAARAAVEADLPVGSVPLGKFNSIAHHLYGETSVDKGINSIVAGNYKKIDIGLAADQPFIGAIGLGFLPELFKILLNEKPPRFGFGWSQIGNKAASAVKASPMTLKIDAFKLEAAPLLFNVNLLPYAVGLPFSEASIIDDHHGEVIFDMGMKPAEASVLTKALYKGKYLFGNEVRMYRGQTITIQPVKGRTLYLDGELVPLPTNILSIKVGEKQVKAFCA
jgi:diacylglycerol kinase family enzyme